MNQQGIAALKHHVLYGKIVDLHPFSPEFAADIARLRNQEKARYFLSQKFKLTEEAQLEWMRQNADRPDEINFVAVNKSGSVVGTFGLYNHQQDCIELGRVVFDLEKVKGGVPYALESAVLVLDIAFDMLEVKEVVVNIREDNYNLIKFVQSLGFCTTGVCEIREQPYVELRIKEDGRLYQKYSQYLSSWMEKLAMRA